ncbi:MAG: RnfABCDGE type electron transport complex subunit B [Candidatus Atribacteria bacterium]|nr:RnfABCDGE type electron transport complex subunit B [Candidatus Atribacteria bacterium]
MSILLPTVLIGILGIVFGYMLAWFAQKFAVNSNPLIKKIEEILPGANCGACGYPGCSGLAEKIVNENAPVSACPVGGVKVWTEIAKLTGRTSEKLEAKRAMLVCQGGKGTVQELGVYKGINDCRAAAVLGVSHLGCINGCLGLGTCEKICPFDAIHMDTLTGLPVIDWEECTGCGKCVEDCPRKVLALVPAREQVRLACSSLASGKEVRRVCSQGCTKCQLCVKACTVQAIRFQDGIIQIDQEKCTLCGLCVEKCPTHCILHLMSQEGKNVCETLSPALES